MLLPIDNDGHNVDSIDALMVVPIITMAYLDATRESRYDAVKKAIQTTRRTSVVLRYANIYSDMLVSIIKEGVSVRDAALTASNAIGIDMASEVRRSGSSRDPMTACYIENAFPVMLFMAVKYGNFEGDGAAAAERMLLASANAGGKCGERISSWFTCRCKCWIVRIPCKFKRWINVSWTP